MHQQRMLGCFGSGVGEPRRLSVAVHDGFVEDLQF
jgi:hypothetical protein